MSINSANCYTLLRNATGGFFYAFPRRPFWVLSVDQRRLERQAELKAKMIELLTAKNNVERILGVTEKEKNRDRQQGAR